MAKWTKRNSKASGSRDVYQEVTDAIIAQLEKGTVPWLRPWKTIKGEDSGIPKNFRSGHAYRGINVPLLWATALNKGYDSDQWLTFKQCQELGGNVRKGEKSALVVFWKIQRFKDAAGEGDSGEGGTGGEDSAGGKVKTIPLLRHYNVFNVCQCDGLPEREKPAELVPEWSPVERAEAVMLDSDADIRHGGDRAFFRSSLLSDADNFIQLPHKAAFASAENYYATALHELTHWTGHRTRLNRDMSGGFGSQSYAREELVAEMGSAFLCAEIGLPLEGLQHPSYIESWLDVLKEDKKAVLVAAGKAQRAADLLLKRKFDDEAEDSPEPDQGEELKAAA